MPYKMLPEEMTKQDIMTLVEQNKTVIVPVLCVLLFLSTAAGKFINVSVLAVIGHCILHHYGQPSGRRAEPAIAVLVCQFCDAFPCRERNAG